MTAYCFVLVIAAILGGVIGYKATGNDLLQQVFLARKFSRRLAEFICVAIVLIVLWLYAPVMWLRIVPGGVCALYVLICCGLYLMFRRKGTGRCSEEQLREIRETSLCTVISMSVAIGAGFLLCLTLAYSPNLMEQLGVAAADRYLCHGLVLGVITVLLDGLGHYLILLRLYPGENETPSRDLARLRKKLRTSHRI